MRDLFYTSFTPYTEPAFTPTEMQNACHARLAVARTGVFLLSVSRAKGQSFFRFFLRIDSELYYKLHYISQYEGRSANGEVIYLIRKAIEEFEKQYSTVEMP